MKNKEIEELLNELKEVTNSKKLSSTYCITNKHWQLLLSYIEQLEKENEKANKYIDFYKDLTEKQNKSLEEFKQEKKQLENNRDKAIEIIDLITPELWNISNKMTYRLKDIKYILKGDSE